ncbi:hypothetical protein GALL_101320 [mine drainage metagenome]|uniref:Uncharacterized protein n=1 Tax=mine drainage metagenome TaxID=410659 RepID=A0A1J5SHH7_9ZZZZ
MIMKNILATENIEHTEMNHANRNPFALSLSKGRSWFDKLTTNGPLWARMFFSVISVFSVANGFGMK